MPPKPKKTKAQRAAERQAAEEEKRRLYELELQRIEEENEKRRQDAIKLQLYRNNCRKIELNLLTLQTNIYNKYRNEVNDNFKAQILEEV